MCIMKAVIAPTAIASIQKIEVLMIGLPNFSRILLISLSINTVPNVKIIEIDNAIIRT